MNVGGTYEDMRFDVEKILGVSDDTPQDLLDETLGSFITDA